MITPGSSICGVVNDMYSDRAALFVAALSMSTPRSFAMRIASSQLVTGTISNLIPSLLSNSFR